MLQKIAIFRSFRTTDALVLASLTILGFVAASASWAQGWNENAPVQFRYSTQGLTNEVYRNQFGTSVVTSTASSSGGGSTGTAQASEQLNNAVRQTYSVSVTGDGNYLVFDNGVNADQTSFESRQGSANTNRSVTDKTTYSEILNK